MFVELDARISFLAMYFRITRDDGSSERKILHTHLYALEKDEVHAERLRRKRLVYALGTMPMSTMQSETSQRRKPTNRTTNTLALKPWYVTKYTDPFRVLPRVGLVLDFLGFSPSRIARADVGQLDQLPLSGYRDDREGEVTFGRYDSMGKFPHFLQLSQCPLGAIVGITCAVFGVVYS